MLRKNPGVSGLALCALALGIGANTAIFTVVNGVLLQPLSYPEADRLVRISRGFKNGGTSRSTSIPKYLAWRSAGSVFDSIAVYDFAGPGMNLSGADQPEQVKGIHVSADYFSVFGATPQMGRSFTKEEDSPGGPHSVVISHGLWNRRFGASSDIIGRPITIGEDSYTVVGVAPKWFQAEIPADLWVPLQADPATTNQGHFLLCTARLRPGVTIEQAQARMKVAGANFAAANPVSMSKEETVSVLSLRDDLVGDVKTALLILTAAVGLVLLIACANVANLLLARAAARQREIAIRAAVGAGKARLARQMLTESCVLGLMGGVLGYLLGCAGVKGLLTMIATDLPRSRELAVHGALDWRVLLAALGLSLLTGILFGLAPAWQVSRHDLNSTLKEAGSRTGTGRNNRLRSVLVVSEMAVALVLLVGAALLIRSFTSMQNVNPGLDTTNVLTLKTSLYGKKYEDPKAVEKFDDEVMRRIAALPGIEAASVATALPLENGPDLPFVIEGRALTGDQTWHGGANWKHIGPGYAKAYRIPIKSGRNFTERDNSAGPPVVIINEAMAKRYWKDANPVGQRIAIGGAKLGKDFVDPVREIVGVIGDVHENGLSRPPRHAVYVPYGQVSEGISRLMNSFIPMSWIVRSQGPTTNLAEAVRKQILAVDSQLAVSDVRTMEQVVWESTARQSFYTTLLSLFAGIALLLAAIGIYGVMSYSVQQRTQEIGIRIALGASRRATLRLILLQSGKLAAGGVVIGLAASFGLSRYLQSLLFEVKPFDPVTFSLVAAVLSGVAMIASYVPALRATRIDPVIALRND